MLARMEGGFPQIGILCKLRLELLEKLEREASLQQKLSMAWDGKGMKLRHGGTRKAVKQHGGSFLRRVQR